VPAHRRRATAVLAVHAALRRSRYLIPLPPTAAAAVVL